LFKDLGVIGAGSLLTSSCSPSTSSSPKTSSTSVSANSALASVSDADAQKVIFDKVAQTTLIDTHEHLCPEKDRLTRKDDWFFITSHYFNNDFLAAGMSREQLSKLYSTNLDVQAK